MMAFILLLINANMSGFVHSDRGQPLQNANVVVIGTNLGAATDSIGNYLIENIPLGNHLIEASIIGYEPETTAVNVETNQDYNINFILKPILIEVDPVTVVSAKQVPLMRSVSSAQISSHPENLILQRVLASFPGIGTMEDYSGQICVRGGDPDENLTVIDGIEFPYPTHFGRFGGDGGAIMIIPNVFIDKINFHPGGFSAEYGGKLSSAIDIGIKQEKDFVPYIDFNIADMTYAISSPYCLVSYRKSHLNFISKLQKLVEGNISIPGYEDIFCKTTLQIGKNNKIRILANKADDELYFKGEYDVSKYGIHYKDIEFRHQQNQHTMGIGWEYMFLKSAMLATSMSRNYIHWYVLQKGKGEVRATEAITPFKMMFKYGSFEAGLSYKFLNFYHFVELYPDTTPTMFVIPGDTVQGADESYKCSGYVKGAIAFLKKFLLVPGIRFDYFRLINKNVFNPRINISYLATDRMLLNFATGKFSQVPRYDYLVINKNLDYENAYHFVSGIEYSFNTNTRFSFETYLKLYQDLISLSTDSLDYFYIGRQIDNTQKGYAKGIELHFEENLFNRFPFQTNYTYSVSKRRLENSEYYADWDQRHIFNIMFGFKISNYLKTHVKWRYASGRPYTPVLDRKQHPVCGKWLPILGDMNSERLPDYHRLDASIIYEKKLNNHKLHIYFDLWNIYNHKNILTYVWDEDYLNEQEICQFLFTPVFGVKVEF